MRTVLPHIPSKHHIPLLKSHWLFTLYVYMIQKRPRIKPELVDQVDLKGRGWEDVRRSALGMGEGKVPDAHFMKGERLLGERVFRAG